MKPSALEQTTMMTENYLMTLNTSKRQIEFVEDDDDKPECSDAKKVLM